MTNNTLSGVLRHSFEQFFEVHGIVALDIQDSRQVDALLKYMEAALAAQPEVVGEWRWVDEKGRAMTEWKRENPPPMPSVSDEKGTMRVEMRVIAAAPTPAAVGQGEAFAMLVAVAKAAHEAMDSGETDADGRTVLDALETDALTAALDAMDELPDLPGDVLYNGWARAEYFATRPAAAREVDDAMVERLYQAAFFAKPFVEYAAKTAENPRLAIECVAAIEAAMDAYMKRPAALSRDGD